MILIRKDFIIHELLTLVYSDWSGQIRFVGVRYCHDVLDKGNCVMDHLLAATAARVRSPRSANTLKWFHTMSNKKIKTENPYHAICGQTRNKCEEWDATDVQWCWWRDSNWGPQASDVTALPTEPPQMHSNGPAPSHNFRYLLMALPKSQAYAIEAVAIF